MTQTFSNYGINLNSANRLISSQNQNRCSFKIADVIGFPKFRKIYLTLPHVILPPTINNISSLSGNNTLTFVENTNPATTAITLTVSLPSGNYNIDDFLTVLANSMTAISASSGYAQTYIGSYNTSTGQVTISMVGSPSGYMIQGYTFQGSDQDLKSFLGFNPSYNNLTVPNPTMNYTFTSPGPANFAVPDAIYIRCSITRTDNSYDTNANQGSGGPSSILRIIPIYVNGYNQVIYDDFEGIEQIR